MIGFLNGDLGDPPGGWPEPFRTKALAGRVTKPVVTELSDEDSAALAAEPRRTLNRLLFPGPLRDYEEAVESYSELSVLPTREFLHGLRQGAEIEVELERGKSLLLAISAIGEPDDRGMRQVVCTVNGQMRVVSVRDESRHLHRGDGRAGEPVRAGAGAGAVRGCGDPDRRGGRRGRRRRSRWRRSRP